MPSQVGSLSSSGYSVLGVLNIVVTAVVVEYPYRVGSVLKFCVLLRIDMALEVCFLSLLTRIWESPAVSNVPGLVSVLVPVGTGLVILRSRGRQVSSLTTIFIFILCVVVSCH